MYEVEKEWLNVLNEIAERGILPEDLENFRNREKIIQMRLKLDYNIDDLLIELEIGKTRNDYLNELDLLTQEDVINAARKFVGKPYIFSVALPK